MAVAVEATASEVCPREAAAHFVERARRIAQSLELGIATHRGIVLGTGQRLERQDRND
jgi:hemoglobin